MNTPSPQTLKGLARLSAVDALACIEAIMAALPTCNDAERLEAYAAALPRHLASLAPEVSLALASLATALVPFRPGVPEDLEALEASVALAWRRVGVAAGTCEVPSGEALVRLALGWSLAPVISPLPLLEALCSDADRRARAVGLGWIAPAVQQLAITSNQAATLLVELAADSVPELRVAALRALARPFIQALTPQLARRRELAMAEALIAPDPEVFEAGLALAAARGDLEAMRFAVENDDRPLPERAEALWTLGAHARREDLALVFDMVARDALACGEGAREFLLAAHRRGVFLESAHLLPFLALFDAHGDFTAEEAARLTFIRRHDVPEALTTGLTFDDPRWLRRAAILSVCDAPAALDVLRRGLEEARDLDVAAAFIDAAGRSPDFEGEAALLGWLDALPECVIPALAVKGGEASAARLRSLAADPLTATPVRRQAIKALMALSLDRAADLEAIAAAVGPHEANLLGTKALRSRDRRLVGILEAAPWEEAYHHTIDPIARLEIYCSSGDVRVMGTAIALFRQIFRGYVRLALAGDFTVKRLLMPALEQHIYRYGRSIVADGRHVRAYLDPEHPETGRDLVTRVALEWLKEEPTRAVTVALLELLSRHSPSAVEVRAITPYWRRGEVSVRRAAIEALLAAGEDARGLELSICRLAEGTPAPVMVQALEAVSAFGARWAEGVAREALGRPEMGVKKAAAAALADIGTPESVPALLRWLTTHDNPGFRAHLIEALRRAAGASALPLLVEALDEGDGPRRRRLVFEAIDASKALGLDAALRLAHTTRAPHLDLVQACLEGRVKVNDASPATLARRLHSLRRTPTPASAPDPATTLRAAGFSPEVARALASAERTPKTDPRVLEAVAAVLAPWLTWLEALGPDAAPDAVLLAVDAAGKGAAGESVATLLGLLGDHGHLDRLPPERVVACLKRTLLGRSAVDGATRLRGALLLRRLPHSPYLDGLERYEVLTRLGAIITRADLIDCLEACDGAPDVARTSRTILERALSIPSARRGEPEAVTRLREGAIACFRLDAAARARWLDDVLAARPLNLAPLPGAPRMPPRPEPVPATAADLEALRADLETGDLETRDRAAAQLIAWDDAHAAWPDVLEAYLSGRVSRGYRRAARYLRAWPTDPARRERALALLPNLSANQRRALTPGWLADWDRGAPDADALLRSLIADGALVPHALERAQAGDTSLLRLFSGPGGVQVRTMVQRIGPGDPAVRHLLPKRSAEVAPADDDDPIDPIAGKSLDALIALINAADTPRGLTVRAIHAIAGQGERAIEVLERLAVDRRTTIRSAALRAHKGAAPRERTLALIARVLRMETRNDVIGELVSSLGHGRLEPTLPALIDVGVNHGNLQVRARTREALLAWGASAGPTLRRAISKARPDRRARMQAILEDLSEREGQ